MLDDVIGYKDVFKYLKQRVSLYKCLLLDEEWEMTTQICDKLKLFHDVTETFPKTKYPTTNVCSLRYVIMGNLILWAINMELRYPVNYG